MSFEVVRRRPASERPFRYARARTSEQLAYRTVGYVGQASSMRGVALCLGLMLLFVPAAVVLGLQDRGELIYAPIATGAAAGYVVLLFGPLHRGILGFGLFAVVLLTRPSLVGEVSPWPALLVLLPMVLTLFPLFRGFRVVDWAWLGTAVAALAWTSWRAGFGIAAIPTFIGIASLTALAARASGQLREAIRTFISLSIITLAWQVVAYLPLLGWRISPTALVNFGVEAREGWIYSTSPLGAIVFGSGGLFPDIGPRLTGWFGEPGILAAFAACVAMLSIATYRRWVVSHHLVAVSTIIFTQSLAGILAYLAGIALWLLLSGKRIYRFFGTAVGVLSIVAVAGGGALSLERKTSLNSLSISDRLDGASIVDIVSSWIASPLGTGRDPSNPLGDINLLQSSVTNGPAVFVFWLLFFLVIPLVASRSNLRFIAPTIAAVAITVSFAQPPYLPTWVAITGLTLGIGIGIGIGVGAVRGYGDRQQGLAEPDEQRVNTVRARLTSISVREQA